MKPKGPNAIVF